MFQNQTNKKNLKRLLQSFFCKGYKPNWRTFRNQFMKAEAVKTGQNRLWPPDNVSYYCSFVPY